MKAVDDRIPAAIGARLALPLIAAPMLRVSGPDLVVAACRAGVVGAFPTRNARTTDELDAWLTDIEARLSDLDGRAAPICPNLIMRDGRLAEDLACVARHGAEVAITSVGSPAPAVKALHDAGCLVLADVASLRHAELAIAAGADGLILLTAGAGGQTGWLNPFAFVRAARAMFDGIVVLAGGVSDGHALAAARVLGCDLAYMGTRFIATCESMASAAYRRMLVEASMDEVLLTSSFTGLPANMLAPSITAAGLDPKRLDESMSEARARERYGAGGEGPRRWIDIWSAGHSVSGVTRTQSVRELVEETRIEFEAAI
ncbi:MAG: NAD(P)H-dependent flavin oxidoreductase [Caulobacteraceae bacterium]